MACSMSWSGARFALVGSMLREHVLEQYYRMFHVVVGSMLREHVLAQYYRMFRAAVPNSFSAFKLAKDFCITLSISPVQIIL